ncbi:MAG: type IV secretory system conjugative DNA transfer family protein [Clostridiales bacterium]|jgi:type IV secretion system protein VirD4|nr:type IV secretory system conjugative DNA transfer family protein [Clostridiales bacterium]
MNISDIDIKAVIRRNIPFVITGIIVFAVAGRFDFIPVPNWVAGIIGGIAMKLAVYIKGKNAKNWRQNEEYGSARWGRRDDIRPFIDPNPKNNIILTKTESLTMNSRPKDPKHARNKNVLVVGGSGSGKTRFYLKPNLMQCESKDYPISFVVTDPKGTVLEEMGKFLSDGKPMMQKKRDKNGKVIMRNKDKKSFTVFERIANFFGKSVKEPVMEAVRDKKGQIIWEREPYTIKVLNTIDFDKSMTYNPLAYIRCEADILRFVDCLIANTKGEGNKSGEDFWVKAEALLYQALIGYIFYEEADEDKNMNTLVKMLNSMSVSEDDENAKNAVDYFFDALEGDEELCEELGITKNAEHFALIQYKAYKQAAGKTAKSILISCSARLAPFAIKEVRDLLAYDQLELDKLGGYHTGRKRKNPETGKIEKEIKKERFALFVIISDTNTTFNFIVSLMYSQLFDLLCDRAYKDFGGRLPVHVRCLLDEFPNIGLIPNFEKLISVFRSREISASVIVQAQSQLKAIYKDNMETITGNMDTTLFLGGKEKTTLKDLEEILGKQTVTMFNTSVTKGNQESHGQNYQRLARSLMSTDEIAVMDGSKCILQVRGVYPFLSQKFDITAHHNFKYLADSDENNTFDVAEYVKPFKESIKTLFDGINPNAITYTKVTEEDIKKFSVTNQKSVDTFYDPEDIDIV